MVQFNSVPIDPTTDLNGQFEKQKVQQLQKQNSSNNFNLANKEYVTWSKNYGGGWSKTHRITRGRVGGHLVPSSTIIFAPCHIPLKAGKGSFEKQF